ncbi:MAG: 1-deoxy-D-xylulose-5-phosphate synthase [Oligoflexia bacterium]|nr:1-deoxy-D-xylulose-5-phosphate synthase [Oligoflexia bacterium]
MSIVLQSLSSSQNLQDLQISQISQRDSFWNEMYEIAKKDRDVIVLAADMGAPALDKFRRDFGGQFFNTGIAEQNTITTAAGLALAGKKVYAYAIAPFITLRCFEQIKCLLAMMNIPVKLVGVGPGFSYEDSGPTHHTVEDISIMRILPNMKIFNSTDSKTAKGFARLSYECVNPCYIRLDRQLLPDIYGDQDDFKEGMKTLIEGKDSYIVTTGNMVHSALRIVKDLNNSNMKNINVGVIDIYKLPIDQNLFLSKVINSQSIITLEEHTLAGGLGSNILEIFSDNSVKIPVKRYGLNFNDKYCYKYGGRENMNKQYGLDIETLQRSIQSYIFSIV